MAAAVLGGWGTIRRFQSRGLESWDGSAPCRHGRAKPTSISRSRAAPPQKPRARPPLTQAAGGALAAAAKAHGIASLFAALPALPALLPLATPAGGSAAAVLPAAAAAAAGEEAALERAAVAALVLGAVGGLYEGNVRWAGAARLRGVALLRGSGASQ